MVEKKYLNLYRMMKNRICSGEYAAGEKLPSKRVMADKTGCSTITVERAYAMLAEEGYIKTRERSGYYVCALDVFLKDRRIKEQVGFSYLPEEKDSRNRDFEYSLWFKTVRRVLSEKGDRLFVKSPNKGCAVLRNAIADYLLTYRGMVAEPARIIIGSGSEQLYESVVKILGRDKCFGIEDPSYEQIEAVYLGEGVRISKLAMGADGIESEALLKGEMDVLHVTPFCSYPTGVTTSASKRYEYLKWAGEGRYIVEDDFNSEFFMPGQPIEPLYSLDSKASVIYINTFSKSLSPSMRMGYMILPEALMPIYDERLGQFSCTVPVLDQYVLAEFIASGNFERHLNRMRRKMKV
ncbi:MAG: PLP-dependent aminotransferase family protein [Ruminococcaceae bacterium]|nr:PLP-dependent aminotransferase family protein [Oscillospiraceae bacterium]